MKLFVQSRKTASFVGACGSVVSCRQERQSSNSNHTIRLLISFCCFKDSFMSQYFLFYGSTSLCGCHCGLRTEGCRETYNCKYDLRLPKMNVTQTKLSIFMVCATIRKHLNFHIQVVTTDLTTGTYPLVYGGCHVHFILLSETPIKKSYPY